MGLGVLTTRPRGKVKTSFGGRGIDPQDVVRLLERASVAQTKGRSCYSTLYDALWFDYIKFVANYLSYVIWWLLAFVFSRLVSSFLEKKWKVCMISPHTSAFIFILYEIIIEISLQLHIIAETVSTSIPESRSTKRGDLDFPLTNGRALALSYLGW